MEVIFSDDLQVAAVRIREMYPTLTYDHRPELPPVHLEGWSSAPWHSERFRRGYACFKYAVAAVLQPRSICEIGVGSGVAGLAFLRACPRARYLGIDDETDSRLFGFDFVGRAQHVLSDFDAKIVVADAANEGNRSPEPRCRDCLIGSLAAEALKIAAAENGLAWLRQTSSPKREVDVRAADNSDEL